MRMNTEVLWLGFQPCLLEPRHNSIFLQSHHLEGWDKITVNSWLAWLTVSSRPVSAIQNKILSHYLPLSPCQKKKNPKLEIPHSPIKNFTEKGMVTFVINRGTHHPAGLPRHPCHALPLPLPPPPPLPHPPAPRPGPGLDRSLRRIRLTWLPEVLSGHYRLMVHCRGPKRRTRGINQNHKVSFTSTNHPKEKTLIVNSPGLVKARQTNQTWIRIFSEYTTLIHILLRLPSSSTSEAALTRK